MREKSSPCRVEFCMNRELLISSHILWINREIHACCIPTSICKLIQMENRCRLMLFISTAYRIPNTESLFHFIFAFRFILFLHIFQSPVNFASLLIQFTTSSNMNIPFQICAICRITRELQMFDLQHPCSQYQLFHWFRINFSLVHCN